MKDPILVLTPETQHQQNQMKDSIVALIKNEKVMLKTITYEDADVSDLPTQRVIIDFKTFNTVELID